MRETHIQTKKLLIAFIILSQLVMGQNKTDKEYEKLTTVKVWENLTWSSTETDIKQKYGEQLTILETPDKYGNEYYCPFIIKNYELGKYTNFKVSFLFNEKSKKLARINLNMDEPKDVLSILQDLKKNLDEKYGKPIILKETPKYNIKWYNPESEIELEHIIIKGLDKTFMNSITLSYKKNEKKQQIITNSTKQLDKQFENQKLEIPIYKLFPTENYWTFIKLDTRNGKMWQVHFSVSEEGFQGEKDLNTRSLTLTDEEINGRFTLFPTKNIYNFLLLDQLTGKTYQVQWNDDFFKRIVEPIW